MTETTGTPAVEIIKTAIEDILKTIDQEREREIITRRFGLYERLSLDHKSRRQHREV